jgi:hypothetical protein
LAHGDENQEKQRRASGGLGTGGGANPSAKTLHTRTRRREKTLGKNGGWLRDGDTAGELKRKIKPGPDLAERKPSEAGGGALSGRAKTREPQQP